MPLPFLTAIIALASVALIALASGNFELSLFPIETAFRPLLFPLLPLIVNRAPGSGVVFFLW